MKSTDLINAPLCFEQFALFINKQKESDLLELKNDGYDMKNLVGYESVFPCDVRDFKSHIYILVDKKTGKELFNRTFKISIQ